MVLCQINTTAFYQMTSAIWNPWHLMDFFKMVVIAPVISGQIAVESFYVYSAFLVSHQCFKLLKKENKRYLSTKDIL